MNIRSILSRLTSAAISCIVLYSAAAAPTSAADNTEPTELPARFDLRDEGAMTSVKHQYYGSCCIFASTAAIESNMIKHGMADSSIDLAEEHYSWFTFGKGSPEDPDDPLAGDGVNLGTEGYQHSTDFWKMIGTLACWKGVVPASEIPDCEKLVPIDESLRYASVAHLQNAIKIDPEDRDDIKRHLMEKGAMHLSYFSIGKPEHYSGYGGYYQTDWDFRSENNPTDLDGGGHAVCLCGWDDNFPKEHFIETPPADGAWICKNSWGPNTSAGIDGYTYISYYDKSVHDIIQYDMEPTDNYDGIYQRCGGAYAAYTVRNKGWAYSNIYTARKDENLAAVSIMTHEADLPYEISIYALNEDYADPRDGQLLAQVSGTEHYAGYHTYQLETPCKVTEGQIFSAVVKTGVHLSTTVFFDRNADNSGTSYYMIHSDKGEGSWTDSTTVKDHGGVLVKVFTKDGSEVFSGVRGDVNGDGLFNIADLVMFQKWLAAVPETELNNWQAADLCKDENLDVFDLCVMRREILMA